jgi:hypothetical protein
MRQYTLRVQADVGTDINQKALAQAVGRTPDENSGGGY